MLKQIKNVAEFQKAMNQPVRDKALPLSANRIYLRTDWMLDEIEELRNAETVVDQVDALIDIIYFATGTLVEIGLTPEKAEVCWDAVHAANMEKLFPDGKPRFDESGKVIKPDNWQAPEKSIKEILES